MAKTSDDLVENVLAILGITDPLEQISVTDNTTVSNQYTTSLEDLRDQGLVYWELNSIPEVVFDALSQYVAYHVAPKYGVPQDMSFELDALRRLRRHISKRRSSQPVEAIYY